ncbi:ubiquinone biosynthesis O-methyltransferase, mitochondrial-like [Anneissia japonica]|uniref:ubiquinone biosynthesis O-methyltransferase, mitochondrial-like n=1 Tax=Anneissia japonica TaxID=1529436 RepID=UPI001425871C|nr:ubiquinone biosynthesis O-methyltransferase, mitochondrial-like [Anneissia japonica]
MKLPRYGGHILRSTKQYQLSKCGQHNNRFLCTGANRVGAMDPEELRHFRRLADKWWNYNGVFKPLHSMNLLRVPFVRDALLPYSASSSDSRPLEGLDVLDVGCGGGLLSEPLARLGANVTGIDLVAENISAAAAHASRDPSLMERLTYQHCSVNDLLADKTGHYDAVVMSEVVEHITNKEEIIQPCCTLLKESGSIFITTINKTTMSQLLAVYAVENLLSIVPKGTHDWDKFIEPEEMKNILKLNNCHTYLIHGMQFNPLTNQWSWSSDTSMNYALHAVKE